MTKNHKDKKQIFTGPRESVNIWIAILCTVVLIVLAIVAVAMRRSIVENSKLQYTPIHKEERLQLKSEDTIIAEVEAAAKEEKHKEAAALIPRDDWFMLLVNKDNKIDSFKTETSSIGEIELDKRVTESLKSMVADAEKAGLSLLPYSGYRDFKTQQKYYDEIVKANLDKDMSESEAKSAENCRENPPEYSEHCTGLAVDILSANYKTKDRGFSETDEFKWLTENAADYGFIIRYPDKKEDITGVTFKPYHFRYVGKEQAALILQSGLTLEEYLAQ